MTRRNVIVRSGIRYRSRSQIPSGAGHVPRYRNLVAVSGGVRTAFRHVRLRKGEYKEGVFQFVITRDDGTVIDETTLRYYGQGINIYQKKDEYPNPTETWHLRMVGSAHGRDPEDADDLQYWDKQGDVWKYKNDSDPDYVVEFSYNTVSQIWTVPFYVWNKPTGSKKCFARFICDDSVNTWYKKPTGGSPEYAYKDDDLFKDEDLIKPKFYDIAMPYWVVTYTWLRGSISCSGGELSMEFVDGVARNGSYAFFSDSYVKTTNVKSSIPYKITWKTRDSSPRTKRAQERFHVSDITYQTGTCWNGEEWVDVAPKCCELYPSPYSTCAINSTSGGPFTLVANTINIQITDSPISIEEDVVEFSGSIDGVDHIATFSGGADEPSIPVCDEGPEAVSCDPCENSGNTPFDYTHWYPGVYDCVTIIPDYDYE